MEFNRIIDYIIEQADRYDIKNLEFEQDIKFQLSKLTDSWISSLQNTIIDNIDSTLKLSKTMIRIQNITNQYISACKKEMIDKFNLYYKKAYENTGDLLSLGEELTKKFNIQEMRRGNQEYDEDTIDYIQKHAFELLKGHSQQKVEQLRARLGELFLLGQANKINVRSEIERILNVGRSKAEEIAQTELSRAYNIGSMNRLYEYQRIMGVKIKKYWHGFKYSERTCEYCRPRIGNVYELDDDEEVLPAHPRCRCVWLPFLNGWDKPINRNLITRANMLNTAYNADMLYQRINNRLGIDYASFLKGNEAEDYISGDRTTKMNDALIKAREAYINQKISSFNIAKDNSRSRMSTEYNQQMSFWKQYVAGLMADKDQQGLYTATEAIKGVMLLPWSVQQLSGWNELIRVIQNYH